MIPESIPAEKDPIPRLVVVTPELADELLSRASVNRRLDLGQVDYLAEAIRRGEWQLTHQGIALDGPLASGALLDGQHRLHAIIKANTAVRIFAFEGLPASAFPVLDTGKRRSGADALSSTGEKYLSLLSSTIRHVILFKTMPDSSWSSPRARVTNDRILAEYNANAEGFRAAVSIGRIISRQVFTSQTAAAVGYFVTTEAAPTMQVDKWVQGVTSGANLEMGDPRLALRKVPRDLQKRGSRRRLGLRDQVAMYIKAWNAWVENRKTDNLRLKKGEKMPMPAGHSADL
ncbi:hypothetical protein [Kitasatospora sp. NPDC057738]|uniref:hypothetical protein n=1 Tax=Kitasatospora sp. NPDC057738 TaxID=3346233 RepID=UPI0036BC0CF9